jgi:hypothetical protein
MIFFRRLFAGVRRRLRAGWGRARKTETARAIWEHNSYHEEIPLVEHITTQSPVAPPLIVEESVSRRSENSGAVRKRKKKRGNVVERFRASMLVAKLPTLPPGVVGLDQDVMVSRPFTGQRFPAGRLTEFFDLIIRERALTGVCSKPLTADQASDLLVIDLDSNSYTAPAAVRRYIRGCPGVGFVFVSIQEGNNRHMNLLTFDTRTQTMELFEPHGTSPMVQGARAAPLVAAFARKMKFTFEPDDAVCARGPQSIHRPPAWIEGAAWCVVFSALYTYIRILNTGLPASRILEATMIYAKELTVVSHFAGYIRDRVIALGHQSMEAEAVYATRPEPERSFPAAVDAAAVDVALRQGDTRAAIAAGVAYVATGPARSATFRGTAAGGGLMRLGILSSIETERTHEFFRYHKDPGVRFDDKEMTATKAVRDLAEMLQVHNIRLTEIALTP